jgi:hypothetical protein
MRSARCKGLASCGGALRTLRVDLAASDSVWRRATQPCKARPACTHAEPQAARGGVLARYRVRASQALSGPCCPRARRPRRRWCAQRTSTRRRWSSAACTTHTASGMSSRCGACSARQASLCRASLCPTNKAFQACSFFGKICLYIHNMYTTRLFRPWHAPECTHGATLAVCVASAALAISFHLLHAVSTRLQSLR